jgi:RNA polymerase sigma factor for flagellar operon FliA
MTETQSMMIQYQPLVRKIAASMCRARGHMQDVDDLASEGLFGLHRAIERFDPKRGKRFEAYAGGRIRGAMLDAMREWDWVPRLARERKEQVPRIDSIQRDKFQDRHGRACDFRETIQDSHSKDGHKRVEDRDEVRQAMTGLKRTEHLLLTLHYLAEMKLKDSAKVIGFSESRGSQICAEAFSHIRSRSKVMA